MLFETKYREARLIADLEQFSALADRSDEIGRQLLEKGLGLLGMRFGGIISTENCQIDPAFIPFEKELIKERIASWSITSEQGTARLGYKSNLLDDLLSAIGVAREDLEDLSRPLCTDQTLALLPWAWRYARAHLDSIRTNSFRDSVNQEKLAEVANIGLQPPSAKRPFTKQVASAVDSALVELGFEKSPKTYGRFSSVFTNVHRVGSGVALEIAHSVEAMPVGAFPLTQSIYFMPLFDLSGGKEITLRTAARGGFFKRIESLVPNFGFYSAAWSEPQLSLALYAYDEFVRLSVPSIEDVLANLTAANGSN